MTRSLDVQLQYAMRTLCLVAAAITLTMPHHAAYAASAAETSRDAQAALQSLYAKVPAAKAIGAKAQAVLVFPKITKAGLGIGGQYGDGALIKAFWNWERTQNGLPVIARKWREELGATKALIEERR